MQGGTLSNISSSRLGIKLSRLKPNQLGYVLAPESEVEMFAFKTVRLYMSFP